MDNFWIADKIKKQIEALILEAILAVLDKLTQQVMTRWPAAAGLGEFLLRAWLRRCRSSGRGADRVS
jgi:hypothetical protein